MTSPISPDTLDHTPQAHCPALQHTLVSLGLSIDYRNTYAHFVPIRASLRKSAVAPPSRSLRPKLRSRKLLRRIQIRKPKLPRSPFRVTRLPTRPHRTLSRRSRSPSGAHRHRALPLPQAPEYLEFASPERRLHLRQHARSQEAYQRLQSPIDNRKAHRRLAPQPHPPPSASADPPGQTAYPQAETFQHLRPDPQRRRDPPDRPTPRPRIRAPSHIPGTLLSAAPR